MSKNYIYNRCWNHSQVKTKYFDILENYFNLTHLQKLVTQRPKLKSTECQSDQKAICLLQTFVTEFWQFTLIDTASHVTCYFSNF